jgi:hypothetical protein
MVPSIGTRGLVMLFRRRVATVTDGAARSDKVAVSPANKLGARDAIDAEMGTDDSTVG